MSGMPSTPTSPPQPPRKRRRSPTLMTDAESGDGRPTINGLRATIADESVLFRAGVARLLQDAGALTVWQTCDGEALLQNVRRHRPDVAIVDVSMPTQIGAGLRAATAIREELPEVGVLVLSRSTDDSFAAELLADNAAGFGYLLKDRIVDVPQFIDAVRRVARGGSALDPLIVSKMLGRYELERPLDALTKREYQVLTLMAEGRTNQAISEQLVITRRATEKHVTSIFNKLNLQSTPSDHRRVLAVLKFIQGR